MKINRPVHPVHIGVTNPYQQQKMAKVGNQNKSTGSQDQLQISDEAKAMLEQKHEVSSKAVSQQEREAKVEQIKLKIAQGKYEVDSQAIADNISRFWFR